MNIKEDIELLLDQAKTFLLTNNYDEAEKILKRILKMDEDNLDALYHLGILYEAINEYEKAKEIYLKILKKNPDNKDVKERLENLQNEGF